MLEFYYSEQYLKFVTGNCCDHGVSRVSIETLSATEKVNLKPESLRLMLKAPVFSLTIQNARRFQVSILLPL